MKKTIYIEGAAFEYEEETLNYDVTCPMSHDEAVILLRTTKQLLDQKELPFYLGYGTLLGAVRNHDIIPGDEDLDIIVRDENKLRGVIPFLSENGLRLIRAVPGNVYSFRLNNKSYIDIYILRRIPMPSIWSWYCYSIANKEYCPKRLWKETETIPFLDGEYLCPKRPERILELWYGKDWRIPKSGHTFYYGVKSHWYWEHQWKPGIQKAIAWPYWRHLILKRFKSQAQSLEEWRKHA